MIKHFNGHITKIDDHSYPKIQANPRNPTTCDMSTKTFQNLALSYSKKQPTFKTVNI